MSIWDSDTRAKTITTSAGASTGTSNYITYLIFIFIILY